MCPFEPPRVHIVWSSFPIILPFPPFINLLIHLYLLSVIDVPDADIGFVMATDKGTALVTGPHCATELLSLFCRMCICFHVLRFLVGRMVLRKGLNRESRQEGKDTDLLEGLMRVGHSAQQLTAALSSVSPLALLDSCGLSTPQVASLSFSGSGPCPRSHRKGIPRVHTQVRLAVLQEHLSPVLRSTLLL